MPENSPLTDLYGDKESYDQERLAEALDDTLGVDKETGDPIFQEGWNELDGKGKTTAFLLYRAAADALGELEAESRGIDAAELTENVGLGRSTVSSYLSRLDFVKNSEEADGHLVPDSAIGQAIQFLEEKKE